MTGRTIYLARLIGLFELVSSVTIFINAGVWAAGLARGLATPPFQMLAGMAALAVGLALVLAHNRWDGLIAVLVTLFGWLNVVRGILLLLLPSETLIAVVTALDPMSTIRLFALLPFAFGVYLTYAGFTATADR